MVIYGTYDNSTVVYKSRLPLDGTDQSKCDPCKAVSLELNLVVRLLWQRLAKIFHFEHQVQFVAG